MKEGEKRTFRQDWKILFRGIGILCEISPRQFFYHLAAKVPEVFMLYFPLYMSAELVDALLGSCDIRRLIHLAAVTLLGTFLGRLLCHVLVGRCEIWDGYLGSQIEMYLSAHQNKVQYSHLENPDVALLREEINAFEGDRRRGLSGIADSFSCVARDILRILVSGALVVSLFQVRGHVKGEGFAGFANSPEAVGLFLAVLVINMGLAVLLSRWRILKVAENTSVMTKADRDFNAYEEVWGEDVTIFGMKDMVLEAEEKVLVNPALTAGIERTNMIFNCVSILQIFVLGTLVFLITGAKAYLGIMGIGSFILYEGAVRHIVYAAYTLVECGTWLRVNNGYLLKLYRFLDLPDSMYKGSLAVEKRDDIDYEIAFKNVSFRYPGTENWALRNISVKLRVGDKLAIVGENGSGKTTFIKLLCRLYDPTEGKITLNGIDITRYRYEEYLDLFSVVFQDYRLFPFSIGDNVAAGFDYDQERVEDCLVRAGFGGRLRSLKEGAETCLGREYDYSAVELSGGEAQKVAMARALYKNAPFYVLDEPGAALDPIAEAAAYESFQELVRGKNAVYISHRLSSCRFCDDIMVFEKGRLVQRGNHDTLVKAEGKYRELWNAQAGYYAGK